MEKRMRIQDEICSHCGLMMGPRCENTENNCKCDPVLPHSRMWGGNEEVGYYYCHWCGKIEEEEPFAPDSIG